MSDGPPIRHQLKRTIHSTVSKRKFAILSCLLAVVAIACQFTWLSYCGSSLTLRARSVTPVDEKITGAIAQADQVLVAGHLYHYLGIGTAIAAFLLAVVAKSQREPGLASLPLVFLACYVLTLFILV
jgi:hypothetical protein